MAIQSKIVETDSGEVFYKKINSHKTPSLMFIHGAGGDSRYFMNQLRFFSNKRKAVALDLPGHGRSRFQGLPGLDDYVEAIAEVAYRESSGPLVLTGHSMGGPVCLAFLKKHPELVHSLVLVSTSPHIDIPDKLYFQLREDPDGFVDLMIDSVFSYRVAQLARGLRKEQGIIDIEILKNDLDLCRGMDLTGSLNEIDIPVLVIGNLFDRVIPFNQSRLLAEGIKTARLYSFSHESHVPFFEQSREFNSVLHSFIE